MRGQLPIWMVFTLTGIWLVSAGLVAVGIVVAARRLPLSSESRVLRLAIALGIFLGWMLLVSGLAGLGAFRIDRDTGLRVPLPLAIVIPVILAYACLRCRAWREIVLAVPNPWLVAIQLFRAAGSVLLVAGFQGTLPRAFAIPAGLGDCLVGITAPLVAVYAYQKRSRWTTVVRAWNYIGILDLVVAGALGILTSPLELSRIPLVMIPALRVPLAYILHVYSLYVLRESRRAGR